MEILVVPLKCVLLAKTVERVIIDPHRRQLHGARVVIDWDVLRDSNS